MMKKLILICCLFKIINSASNQLNIDESHEINGKWREVLEKRYHVSRKSPTLKGDVGEPLILSKYLKRGEIEKARILSTVENDHLIENISSHAGYITVDETYNSNLWFWYFPVEETSVEKAPLVIWLQGGPGASSLFGLFEELGPFSVDETGTYLKENEFSWHKTQSLLFIDNPVGTGFSFTDSDEGYATNQTMIGKQLYKFITQFLLIFHELKDVPLYLSGESYAGKHIPSFAYEIHKRNPDADMKVNLQGLAIGNGFIDPATMLAYSKYLYQLGLVDDEIAGVMAYYENECEKSLQIGNYTRAFRYFGATLGTYIVTSRIYNLYNYVYEDEISIWGAFTDFVQKHEVRKALHVGDTKFNSIGKVYEKLVPDFMTSAKPWLEELLEHYKVMLYSGQMDIIVAYPLSVRTYRSMQWNATKEYLEAPRKPWFYNDVVAGFTKRAGNLLEVFIRNAGHMVPTDQPERSLMMLKYFINDEMFPGESSDEEESQEEKKKQKLKRQKIF